MVIGWDSDSPYEEFSRNWTSYISFSFRPWTTGKVPSYAIQP